MNVIGARVVLDGLCLDERDELALQDFARACGVPEDYVRDLVAEGLVEPLAAWRFGATDIARVRRIRRLQRDFEASLHGVAVMLDLIDEVARLRAALLRSGADA